MAANPYSPDERRVCDYLIDITKGAVGCGPDPIGFLIASHAWLVAQRAAALATLNNYPWEDGPPR